MRRHRVEVSLVRIMRTSARIGILALLAVGSVAIGIQLGAYTFRQRDPLAGATAASEAGSGLGFSNLDELSWSQQPSPLQTMSDVLEMVESEYVEKVDADDKFAVGAARTMLYTLDDPRTRYWAPDQTALLEQQLDGKFVGIGAVLAVVKEKRDEVEQRRVCVIAPVPGGPCDAAGVRAGDYITGIDGRWVIAYDPRLDLNRMTLRTMPEREYREKIKDATKKLQDGISWPRALEQLTQPTGKPLELTIERKSAPAPITVKVTRNETQVAPVEFHTVAPGTGYLRITQFTASAPAQVTSALKTSGRPARVILDLRDNAGGPDLAGPKSVVSSAAAVLSALGFSGEFGKIARGSSRHPIASAAQSGSSSGTRPSVAVLINKGTANIAEVAAAYLQARAGAKLIGAPSQGDSSYQKLIKLSRGAMTLTAGSYFTVAGKAVPATGLSPDVPVATGGPRWEKDAAVNKALALLGRAQGGRS